MKPEIRPPAGWPWRLPKLLNRSGLALTLLLAMVSLAAAQTYPLRAAANGRYLEDQNGTPFFLNADAPWSLISQLTYSQANTYLTDRASRGFNGILTNLIEHHFCDHAPNNINNVPPFTGAVFSTPNEPYFALADSMISRANQLGIVVFLDPIYLGSDPSQGWQAEASAASAATLKGWGTYVGNRYKNYPNIIWVIGADMNVTGITGLRDKIDSMVAGMKAADNVYPGRLYTTHSERGTLAYTHWPESWVTLDNIYGHYNTVGGLASTAYAHAPTEPFILIEGDYEGEGPSPQQIRAQAYWTILGGGCGHIFGNCPIWSCGTTVYTVCGSGFAVVQSALGSVGSVSMTRFNSLFTSRHWYKLVPDLGSAVLTAGAMTGDNLAMVSYGSDSSVIIGYLPTQRQVTINPAVLSGDSIHVQFYSPSSGVYTEIGRYPKVTQNFTPTSSGDWVLVIDTIGSTSSAPAPPTQLTPTSGSTGVPVAPTLTWNASSGATSYRVQVSTDSAFGTTVVNQSGVSATNLPISGLANSTVYYWRVNATNAGGTSAYSSVWKFTTIIATPAAPTLNSPANNAISIALAPTLTWNASSGATSYRVQVSTDSAFGTTVVNQSGVSATNLPISGLANSTVYYWRVNATNAGGTSAYSSVWKFTTIVAAPAAPTLNSPANNAISIALAPTLTWNASSGATSYRVQVSTDSAFGTTVVNQSGVAATNLPISGLANSTVYYWRVNATNAGGTSAYSSVWKFSTIIAAPSSPNPSFPGNDASAIVLAPSLIWNLSLGASSYHLQVSKSAGFTDTVFDQSGLVDTFKALTGLEVATIYFWRVSATNGGGTSTYSTAFRFTTLLTLDVQTDSSRSLLPTSYSLGQNYPNPFNPTTEINFSIPTLSRTQLDIYDALGRKVARLLDKTLPRGNYRVNWNGRDSQGRQLSSGVYFYRLVSEHATLSKKMILLK